MLGEQPQSEEETPDSAQAVKSTSPALEKTSAAQQEREFQQAVQPGSPISILINSAKQPLVVAARDNEPLIKRLTASRERGSTELLTKRMMASSLKGIDEEKEEAGSPSKKDANKKTTVENQKARIVAQMAATFPSVSPVLTEDEGKEKRSSTLRSSSTASRQPTVSSGQCSFILRFYAVINTLFRLEKFCCCCRSRVEAQFIQCR